MQDAELNNDEDKAMSMMESEESDENGPSTSVIDAEAKTSAKKKMKKHQKIILINSDSDDAYNVDTDEEPVQKKFK